MNIVVGEPLVDLASLGISKKEETKRFTKESVQNEKGEIFLPHVLKEAGIFGSTSQIRQMNKQRTPKIEKDPDQDMWRNLVDPEFTEFKVGKKVFWLIVGE